MSYEKQNFVNGQVLTAEHMNHIEDGIVSTESASTAYVDQKVGEEAQARTTAIGAAIAQEVADRNQAIAVEKNNRENQCNYIQNTSVPSQISAAISDEADARNTAISTAIAQEVQNRNSAIDAAIATEVSDRNTAISDAISDVDDDLELIRGSMFYDEELLSKVVVTGPTVNLFNYRVRLTDKGIHTSTGKPGTNTNFDCSDFIIVVNYHGKSLKAGAYMNGAWDYTCVSTSSWAFYDGNMDMLPNGSGATGLNTGVVVPNDAVYFRFSIRKSSYPLTSMYVVLSTTESFPDEYVSFLNPVPGEFILQNDKTLTIDGAAADAKVTGDRFAEVDAAIEELEAGSLSALGAANGDVPVADGAGDWAWGKQRANYGRSIAPVYIGDYLCPAGRLPSCCVKIGGYFYAIDAPTREQAIADQSNAGVIRKFDLANNTELTADAVTADVGHANSIAYDGTTVYVAPIWDTSTGEEVSATYLYTFDSTMTATGTESIPTTAMGVSFDPVTSTLYYTDYYRDIYRKADGAWEKVTHIDFTGIYVSEFVPSRSFNQDFAVYGGRFYISSPQGSIISGDIQEGTSYVAGSYAVSSLDLTARYHIGETEGMEFDADGHLFAILYSGLSSDVIDAFVMELPVGERMPNASSADSYDFHDGTLTLSETTQAEFSLAAHHIRTISQLEVRVLRYNSSVINIPADNNVVDDYNIRINDKIKIAVNGTLTVRSFSVYSGLLNLCCETDPGSTPNLIFTSTGTPIGLLRVGELQFTGKYAFRISTPNRASATLVDVGYDFNRTTVRTIPKSHEGYTFKVGSTNLNDASVFVGTGKISGQTTAVAATYVDNAYFTRSNITSGGFEMYRVTSVLIVLNVRLHNNVEIPAGTTVQVANTGFATRTAETFPAFSEDGRMLMVRIEKSTGNVTVSASSVIPADTYFYTTVPVMQVL